MKRIITHISSARDERLSTTNEKSEPELIINDSGMGKLWEDLMAVRAKIAKEKEEACAAINEKYYEELDAAESNYAIMLRWTN